MSHNRNKPVWPWIMALVIGLPAMYAASFGPVNWIRYPKGSSFGSAVATSYRPLRFVMYTGPSWVSDALLDYLTAGMADEDGKFYRKERAFVRKRQARGDVLIRDFDGY
jgi:hypothetical protein